MYIFLSDDPQMLLNLSTPQVPGSIVIKIKRIVLGAEMKEHRDVSPCNKIVHEDTKTVGYHVTE